MKVLVINPGSTSVKFKLFDKEKEVFAAQYDAKTNENKTLYTEKFTQSSLIGDSNVSIQQIPKKTFENCLERVRHILDTNEIVVNKIGFRVVHGGEKYIKPTILNGNILKDLKKLSNLAPLHNPVAIKRIEQALDVFKGVRVYAVFDTEFHATIPEHAYLYGLPYEFYEEHGIRRYGFHGISHEYLVKSVLDGLTTTKAKKAKVITVHLGGGASIAASVGGRCIDTSMGFTPLEGLLMVTRAGDVDDGVIWFMENELKMKPQEVQHILNHESGLLGLSQISESMEELIKLYKKGQEGAKRAIDVFVYKAAKYIGSYVTALQGVDYLVFSGGIGAGTDFIREKIADDFAYLGIKLDKKKNKLANDADEKMIISSASSQTTVLTFKTNEELQIVRKI